MRKIGVFLSSKTDVPAVFRQAVEDVGAWIGRTGRTLVYGGARKGMMEVLAQTVKRNGGRVFGVVPQIIEDRGLVSDTLDVTFRTVDLNDRKAVMNRESDLLVALPGGVGTLDEVFTVMAAATIGTAVRHVVFYNVAGCWDMTIAAIEDLAAKGLIDDELSRLYSVVTDVAGLACLAGD